ncbi:hypothetical protein GYMLUDRAFT_251459 [Collybiopsis luxurians FD-317 M1]|uniref:Uncharacterized protein n=1 Tax=Collybiopsis luxurians FD-317 M1 TaxID=944289 RepID=A0A0D0APK9_9AGAR|nr:hypothetical protein GYMLUDRAFT_251459 [Collybiopsis luxurians FD-317 M1]
MELQLAKQHANMGALWQEVKELKAELSCINQHLNNATKLLSTQHSIMESQCKDLVELEEVWKEVGVTKELHWQVENFEQHFGSTDLLSHYRQLSECISKLEFDNQGLCGEKEQLEKQLREQEEAVGLQGEALANLQQTHSRVESEKIEMKSQLHFLNETIALL